MENIVVLANFLLLQVHSNHLIQFAGNRKFYNGARGCSREYLTVIAFVVNVLHVSSLLRVPYVFATETHKLIPSAQARMTKLSMEV